MQTSAADCLRGVLTLTENMMRDAESADWQALEQKEQARAEQLQYIDFNALPTNANTREILLQIISLNTRLERLCEAEKKSSLEALTTIERGRKMRKAIENLYPNR